MKLLRYITLLCVLALSAMTGWAQSGFNPTSPAEPGSAKTRHAVFFRSEPCTASFSQSSGYKVAEGTAYSVRVYNVSNYTFSHWTLEGSDEPLTTDATYSATMGTADVRLVAHFSFTPGSPAEPGVTPVSRCALYALTSTVYRGMTTLYPLYLENTGTVSALSFSVVLPAGVSCDPAAIQLTTRTSGHTVNATATPIADGATRLDVSLTGGSMIAGTNGKVVELPLAVAKDAPIDKLPIGLTDATASADGTAFNAISTRPGAVSVEIIENLQAAFSTDRYANRVQFTNTSSEDCKTYLWEFGDGTTSTLASPLHVYAEPGTYTVRLTARGVAKESVVEHSVTIGDPATWTASGDYTLDPSALGLRNFASLDEAVALLSQCTPTGPVTIRLASTVAETYDASSAAALQRIAALADRLESAGVALRFVADQPSTVNLTLAAPTSAALTSLVDFVAVTEGQNVDVLVCGVALDTAVLSAERQQTLCSDETTTLVALAAVSADPRVAAHWYATVSPDSRLTGYTTVGTGNLPAMTIVNTGATADAVNYHVSFTLDGVEFASFIYNINVRPALRHQSVTLTPADGSRQNPGTTTLSWTPLSALATEGYTLWIEETLRDGSVSEDTQELTRSSYALSTTPGATYRWSVTYHGTCDDLTSTVHSFGVAERADLTVSAVTAPDATAAFAAIEVSATVTNVGRGTTLRSDWTDALYYTLDPDDLSAAVRVTTQTRHGSLAPGASYTVTFSATAPSSEVSAVYYFVRTDYNNLEAESAEDNNDCVAAEPTLIDPVSIHASDYAALRALRSALDGDNWTSRRWTTESDLLVPTRWPGVTFDADGYVTAINLADNGLSGQLPAGSDFALSRLATLRLERNAISGDIADFLGGCTALRTLNLSHCLFTELTDVLPASITSLDLSYQDENADLATLPLQEWALGTLDNVVLSTLVSYNHAARDFSARPDLRLYTVEGNSNVGTLKYDAALERYVLASTTDYSQPNGATLVVRPTGCPAADCRLRAALSWTTGDANADDAVDVLDAQHTLNYVLGTHRGGFNSSAANTYADAFINVQDVVATVNLFIDAAVQPAASARRAPAADAPCAGSLSARADGLYLDAETQVAALDIVLSGVRADEVQLSLRRTDFQMIARNSGDGVRVVIISTNGTPLPDAGACILRTARRATVEALDAADTSAQRVSLSIVGATPTAIDAIGADADGSNDSAPADAVYDISGRVSTSQPAGAVRPARINIVGGRKVLR